MIEWYDLNARHEALFLWLAAVLVLTLTVSSGVRRSICDLLKSVANPYIWLPIAGLVVGVAALSVVTVAAGRQMGLWEVWPIVTAAMWTLSGGFSILLHMSDFFDGKIRFRTKAMQILAPSTVITEIVSVAIFPLWIEVASVPILLILTYAVYSKREHDSSSMFSCMLSMYPLGLAVALAVDFINNPETWRTVIQAVAFPIVLTVGALVYLYLLLQIERLRFSVGAKRKKITASQYGPEWPFTIDSAKLCCKHNAVWLEARGKKYGINGTSKSLLEKRGHRCSDVQEIWKDHPGIDGLKINIGRLIQDALELCKSQ